VKIRKELFRATEVTADVPTGDESCILRPVTLKPEVQGVEGLEELRQTRQALSRPIAKEWSFTATSLGDFAASVQQSEGITVVFDDSALSSVGLSTATKVTLAVKELTLREALDCLVRTSGLRGELIYEPWLSGDDLQVRITTHKVAESHQRTIVYPVKDLIRGPGQAHDDHSKLIDSIIANVNKYNWSRVGGPGSITYLGRFQAIVVSHDWRTQDEVYTYLTDLRRTLTPKSREARGGEHQMKLPRSPASEPTTEVRKFLGHTDKVWEVAFSPDGLHALSASEDGTVKLWEIGTGREVAEFSAHREGVLTAAFSPDGRSVLSAGFDKVLMLWVVKDQRVIREIRGHSAKVWSVAFSPDGLHIVSADEQGVILVWDASNGRRIDARIGHHGAVFSICMFPDSNRFVSAGRDGTIRLWTLRGSPEILVCRGNKGEIWNVSVSGDGRRFLSDSGTGICLWDASSGEITRWFWGHQDNVRALAWSPNAPRFLSGGEDATLRVWDSTTGDELHRLDTDSGEILSVCFSGDGKMAISGHQDGSVRLWNSPP